MGGASQRGKSMKSKAKFAGISEGRTTPFYWSFQLLGTSYAGRPSVDVYFLARGEPGSGSSVGVISQAKAFLEKIVEV